MFITFKKNTSTAPGITASYEIAGSEYYHENDSYQLFVDSNLPLATLKGLCENTSSGSLQELVQYLRQDGILVAFDKKQQTITVVRDNAGLGSVYYYSSGNELIFASNMHAIAALKKLPLLKTAVMQWLTFDFLWDGQTLYRDISQVLVDQQLRFSSDLTIASNDWKPLAFAAGENAYSEKQNITKLREEIVQAHSIYTRKRNIVFLSGGIDSVAMLIALDDLVPKDSIENHSFKVKSTLEDETVYAKSIADHLHTPLKIIERDLTNAISLDLLKEKIMAMSNPYPGIWIFANQVNDDKNNVYFAGQDTRLHTPSLNIIDKIAFRYFALTVKLRVVAPLLDLLMLPFRLLFGLITRFTKKRAFIGFKRLSHITNTKRYIERYYFKQDADHYLNMGLPKEFYETARKNYTVSLAGITSERDLYNYIVSVKWVEQYVNDIRYMVDMVKDQGGRLAMPFYNRRLTAFSSTIPFNLANKSIKGRKSYSDKKIRINKFVLRESLKDKIDDKTYYRAKAVSNTFHIIYNQALTGLLRQIISNDLAHPCSVIKQLQLQPFIDFFQSAKQPFEVKDGPYLLKIYYLCCVIVYAGISDNKLV